MWCGRYTLNRAVAIRFEVVRLNNSGHGLASVETDRKTQHVWFPKCTAFPDQSVQLIGQDQLGVLGVHTGFYVS